MTTAAAVIGQASKHVGYGGMKQAANKFCQAFGVAGAWCHIFVSVVSRDAGLRPGIDFPWTAWTPAGVAWFKSKGRWKTSNPKPGDYVYFMWAGVSAKGRGNPPVCHVGVVQAVNSDGSVTTVEGNTSGTANGSQYNGNVVARRVRKSNIVGYGTPVYSGGTAAPTPPAAGGGAATPPAALKGPKAFYDEGDWGYAEVKSLQKTLNKWYPGLPALAEDGDYGAKTKARVRYLQGKSGGRLKVDGVAGNMTLKFLGIRG